MADRVSFNRYIRPICLAGNNEADINEGEVAGWGFHDDSETISDVPRKVQVPILSEIQCFKKENLLYRIIWDEAFCAGKDGVGVCKGDSGSGFYVKRKGKYYLRGIVSSAVARTCS